MTGQTRYHSVVLDEEACKGCTICVTTCPVGAIRVREGKARILAERCIDCGECIRRCPHHAKKALSDSFPDALRGTGTERFDRLVALPAPSLYGQFPGYSIQSIHDALLAIGFDDVYPVASATSDIAKASRSFLDREQYPDLPRPLISSSCPAIVKLVQIRFPTLLDNIVPVMAPMEHAARLARVRAIEKKSVSNTAHIGVFFISPCAGKITEAKAPLGNETSSIDGVFSMKDLHLPLLVALKKGAKSDVPAAFQGDAPASFQDGAQDGVQLNIPDGLPQAFPGGQEAASEIAWGRAGGEVEATIPDRAHESLSVDGMDQCIKILEAAEDGKLDAIDFVELMACTGGCVGGPLSVTNPAIARHAIRKLELELIDGEQTSARESIPSREQTSTRAQPPARALNSTPAKTAAQAVHPGRIEPSTPASTAGGSGEARAGTAPEASAAAPIPAPDMAPKADHPECLMAGKIPSRPTALLLDPDYKKALVMMEMMEGIYEELPGLDCGCCGAPNCHALAEDIVRGMAAKNDCVIILKEQYRELVEKKPDEAQ